MITSTNTDMEWACTGFDDSDDGCGRADGTVVQFEIDGGINHYFCPECLMKAIRSDPRRLFGQTTLTCENCSSDVVDGSAYCANCAQCNDCDNVAENCSNHTARSCSNCGNSYPDYCENCNSQTCNNGCGEEAEYCSASCASENGSIVYCSECGHDCDIVCQNKSCDEYREIATVKGQQSIFTPQGTPQQVAANSHTVTDDGNAVVDGVEFRFG